MRGVLSAEAILAEMKSKADPKAVEGMARFGISPRNTLGISMPTIRGMAKRAGRDHELAQALWRSGIHEAKILAALVDEPEEVTEAQMEKWASEFDSWDVCDQVCSASSTRPPTRSRRRWSGRGGTRSSSKGRATF